MRLFDLVDSTVSHQIFNLKMQLVQVQSYGFLPVVGGNSPASQMPVSVRGRDSPARRRLFDSDPEGDAQELANRRTVERQMDQLQREKTAKWNFDFKNEVPLTNGRYVWQPECRPFNPLPPLTGIKRPIDNNQQLDSAITAPLPKQMKPDSHIHDSINNNHRSVNQTKITGKYLRKEKKIFFTHLCVSQGLNLETRVCIALASVRRGWSYKQKMVGVSMREKSSRSPRSRLVLFYFKRGVGKNMKFFL